LITAPKRAEGGEEDEEDVCRAGGAAEAYVNIETVVVGDPGNAGELSGEGAGKATSNER